MLEALKKEAELDLLHTLLPIALGAAGGYALTRDEKNRIANAIIGGALAGAGMLLLNMLNARAAAAARAEAWEDLLGFGTTVGGAGGGYALGRYLTQPPAAPARTNLLDVLRRQYNLPQDVADRLSAELLSNRAYREAATLQDQLNAAARVFSRVTNRPITHAEMDELLSRLGQTSELPPWKVYGIPAATTIGGAIALPYLSGLLSNVIESYL